MKRTISLLILVAFGLIPLTATAGRGWGRGMGKNPALVKKTLKEVGLSDQQIRRIEALKVEAERAMIDIRTEIDKARLDMQQLLTVDAPNEAAIFTQLEKISALKLKAKKNRVGLMLQARKEMTPDQWQKLQELKAERRMKRKAMRGKRGKRGKRGMGGGFGGGMGPGSGGL